MEFRTNGNKATIGITVLGAISAFSVWSACNPSLFTVAQFTTEQSKKNARFGMKVGVALNALLGAGIYLAYGKKGLFPAVLTTATGVGLYFLYEHMLNKVHVSNPGGQDMYEQAQGFKSGSNSDLQTAPGRPGGRTPKHSNQQTFNYQPPFLDPNIHQHDQQVLSEPGPSPPHMVGIQEGIGDPAHFYFETGALY